jgi:alpha-beta hydrolase superfamily lysophospholipase
MELDEREGVFKGGSGVKLHYRSHRLQSVPFRAAVALIEPPEEGGRLYADLVQQLTPQGYVLYGCTHPEHRRVPGQPGFLEEWNELYGELESFLGLVRALEPDAPLFLAGGHVAGQLALTYALHHPENLSGVIAFYPRLRAPSVPSLLVSLTRAISRIWPAFMPSVEGPPAPSPDPSARIVSGSSPDSDHLSTDPAVTVVTASDIAIPVLIIDAEPPAVPDAGTHNQLHAAPNPHSLHDVESWLDRVLRPGSE